jgi:hypothetical protein
MYMYGTTDSFVFLCFHRPTRPAFKRWLERGSHDVYVIGLQECGSPDKWWKGILDHLNTPVPVVRVVDAKDSRESKENKEQQEQQRLPSSHRHKTTLCATCETSVQAGRARTCCCCRL